MEVEKRVADIERELDAWVEDLRAEAREVEGQFNDRVYEVRDEVGPKGWFRHMVRVKDTSSVRPSFSIEWRRMEWRSTSRSISPKDSPKLYRSTNVKKGPTERYPESRFDPVSAEEANLIANCEDRFEVIRKQLKLIGAIRKQISNSSLVKNRGEEE
ncbi:conjugative transfer protein MobI(A/C) [Thioalkalivibrio sp. ALE19]|uniref:conjugative transfer protein MobI(A/C) n=1 Tax=Thioalkalivibrio sp. ALE19 TaxID=1266909 RepID=UPI0004917677|nr:conjugative transfer protein MobI(A/C) [Thioalkalivibrio sp. ALE19]